MEQERSEDMKNVLTMWQVWAGIAAVLLVVLLVRGANIAAFLPFGLLLICPLMMMFMHGGHDDHTGKKGGEHHHG